MAVALAAWAMAMAPGCRRGRGRGRAAARQSAPGMAGRPEAGLWWGRWGEVPEGAWVAVWIDVWDDPGGRLRLRGSWDMPPWHGELLGVSLPSGELSVSWHEEGVVAVHQTRESALTLRPAANGRVLQGGAVLLRRSRPGSPALRPGLWLSRWTGLPAGMAVETTVTEGPDGWRAAYRYQGRDGSFVGQPQPDGALLLRWREVSARDIVGHGGGRLVPTPLGLRGTYGMGDADEGLGQWAIEPFAEPPTQPEN